MTEPHNNPNPPRQMKTAWTGALWGLLAGFVLGLLDFSLFSYLGVSMKLNQTDVTLSVCLYFAFSFAVLGGLLGKLYQTSQELRQSHHTISTQMTDLEESRKQLAESEKLAAIGRLAACVAHEVRNPLGVIRSTSSMLLEDVDEEDERYKAGTYIVEEVDRLNAFCSSLLEYARPLTLDLEKLQAEELFAQWENLCSERCRYNNVACHIVWSEENPKPTVQADPSLLTQAFSSLVDNALDELPHEGKVELRFRPDPQELVVELADSGQGISEENQSQIFEPFFTTKSSGTGLGLAMALKVVEAHHGTLQVVQGEGTGPEGRGACFQIRVPWEAKKAQPRM